MSKKAINLDAAKKDELRSLCKKHGLKGYGKLSNDGMRAALRALIETDPSYATTGPKTAAEAVVTTSTKPERITQNGVRRPLPESACGLVWAALDAMMKAGITPATKDVRDLSTAKGWNESNSICELSAWRRHVGLSKPRPMPKAKRKSAARLAGLPRMSAEEVVPYTA